MITVSLKSTTRPCESVSLPSSKICNNKLGFPNKVLNKVLGKISSLNINYILVYELDDLKCYEYSSNSYIFYFRKYMDLYKLERGMQKYIMSKV